MWLDLISQSQSLFRSSGAKYKLDTNLHSQSNERKLKVIYEKLLSRQLKIVVGAIRSLDTMDGGVAGFLRIGLAMESTYIYEYFHFSFCFVVWKLFMKAPINGVLHTIFHLNWYAYFEKFWIIIRTSINVSIDDDTM